MRRSSTITLTLLSGVATAVLAACRDETRRCVDQQNRVVPDSLCEAAGARDPGVRAGGGGGVIIPPIWYPYRYYYGGRGYGGIGSVLRGGSYTPSRSYGGRQSSGGSSVRSGTARGGFGSIGSGRGGFGGS